ncbi:TniQ family protein [Mycobacterium sp. WUMAC-067]|uniref:TniQ family protein n=1 Tax=unclassified Mycobacterium TaxID=2642494 RepID=UPI001CD91BCB|nr:TniQ family protein [Mycobacterium sp. WUMAC-067]MCA2317620.1 TniQ family protein [Mycobacterium sp. WUMAC-025]
MPWLAAVSYQFGWIRFGGEAFDSWLEATARHLGVTVGAVARAADISIATRPGWSRWLSANQLRAVEAATGVSQEVVRAMTLSTYDGAALQLDPVSHRLEPTFPFGPLVGSRYCAECLTESCGRWQLIWRLGWSFLCIRHNRLLADACTECGKRQRRHQVYRHADTRNVLMRR